MPKMFSIAKHWSVAALVALSMSGAAWSSPIFSLTSTPRFVSNPGGSLTLNINADDFTDLYAYQLSLNFDPTLFHAVAVNEGSFLSTAGTTFFDGGTIDNAAGMISFVFDTLIGPGPGATGSGLLDSVTFTALRRGIGIFSLSDVLALNSSFNTIAAGTPSLAVTVPEPGSAALLVIAALAMAAVSLRKLR